MDTFFHHLGLTLDMAGKVLIGATVLRVHLRFLKEHKIDKKVFQEMRMEQRLGILGIALVVAGYFLELFFLK
jgi:hypothetical protein